MILWQHVLKVSLSAVAAIWLAQLFHLENALAAGIISILTVLDTRQASLQKGYVHILATVLAFIIASAIFALFGFYVWAFGLYLLIFVPLAYKFDLQSSIAPVSVLVTHFMLAESISWQWQINGMLIIIFGVATALLAHLWMPSQTREIEWHRDQVENKMRDILGLMGNHIDKKSDYTDQIETGLEQLSTLLADMYKVALFDYNNQVFEKDEYDLDYVRMRQEQLTVMHQMANALSNIHLTTRQNTTLSSIFDQTAKELDESNSGYQLLQNIDSLYRVFREAELPQTREEFETRAILYQLLINFERFLDIKHDFYHESQEERGISGEYTD